jgi:hypothetical protein
MLMILFTVYAIDWASKRLRARIISGAQRTPVLH